MSINPIKITNSTPLHKRVAFLSFDGLSDPLGQSQILPYLSGLAGAGFVITIFSCEKPLRLSTEEVRLKKQLEAAGISWHYLIYDEQGNWRSRWQYARQLYKMVSTEHRKQSFDLLHCRSYLAALSGKKMGRKFGVPFLFDMRGLWADERIDGGIWKKSHPFQDILYRYFKRQEKILLKEAAAVISLTRAGLKELSRLYPENHLPAKTTVIPCCTDTELFNPEKNTETIINSVPNDAQLFVYTGSIGTWYLTREMLDCLLLWRKKIPNLHLLILTRDQDALRDLIRDRPLPPDFISVASASHREVPAYLKLAKAAIFFIKPVYSKLASSPTKMAECWSMGLPIITNAGVGDGDDLFEKFNGGILIRDFTERDYQEACDAYLAAAFNKAELRKIAIENFDHRSAIRSYKQVYENILSSSI